MRVARVDYAQTYAVVCICCSQYPYLSGFFIPNHKTLTIVCDCTARLESFMVGYPDGVCPTTGLK